MTNTIYILIIAVIVFIIGVFVFKLLNKNNIEEIEEQQALAKFHSALKKIQMPKVISEMNHKDLRSYGEDLLKTYKAIGYHDKKKHELEEIEWNSWEVSIIIQMYKEDFALTVPQYKEIFPKYLADNTVHSLETKLHPIFNKYSKEITLTGSEKYLKDTVIWSSYEMSVLLLFLARYQHKHLG